MPRRLFPWERKRWTTALLVPILKYGDDDENDDKATITQSVFMDISDASSNYHMNASDGGDLSSILTTNQTRSLPLSPFSSNSEFTCNPHIGKHTSIPIEPSPLVSIREIENTSIVKIMAIKRTSKKKEGRKEERTF